MKSGKWGSCIKEIWNLKYCTDSGWKDQNSVPQTFQALVGNISLFWHLFSFTQVSWVFEIYCMESIYGLFWKHLFNWELTQMHCLVLFILSSFLQTLHALICSCEMSYMKPSFQSESLHSLGCACSDLDTKWQFIYAPQQPVILHLLHNGKIQNTLQMTGWSFLTNHLFLLPAQIPNSHPFWDFWNKHLTQHQTY